MSGTGTPVVVTKVPLPPIVVDGIEFVVPESPIGNVGVVLNARMIPVKVIPLAFPSLTTAGKQLITLSGLYMGHSVKEATTGAGAAVEIYDGDSAAGQLLCPITLVANESTRDWYPLPGVVVETGIYVNVSLGSVSGVVYFGVPENEEV